MLYLCLLKSINYIFYDLDRFQILNYVPEYLPRFTIKTKTIHCHPLIMDPRQRHRINFNIEKVILN